MRKVLLIHISSIGCCNPLVTMLNNGKFGFPYFSTTAFSTTAVWCRVFHSRVFSAPVLLRDWSMRRYVWAAASLEGVWVSERTYINWSEWTTDSGWQRHNIVAPRININRIVPLASWRRGVGLDRRSRVEHAILCYVTMLAKLFTYIFSALLMSQAAGAIKRVIRLRI